jgi:hypothetical protein
MRLPKPHNRRAAQLVVATEIAAVPTAASKPCKGPKGPLLQNMQQILFVLLLMQGPTPETAAPMFPGGAYISYNSVIGARDSRPHEGTFDFAAGLRRDLQLSIALPITTTESGDQKKTGLGDAMFALKYRFLRVDSGRGTTQSSVSLGWRTASSATTSPTDLFLNGSFTYTGLFGVKKLVADSSIDYFVRNDEINSRLWMPYRPYQSRSVGAEWWIGPSLSWQHNVIDKGTVLSPGGATYVSPAAGTILWAGLDFPGNNRRWSFGITRQFRLPGK